MQRSLSTIARVLIPLIFLVLGFVGLKGLFAQAGYKQVLPDKSGSIPHTGSAPEPQVLTFVEGLEVPWSMVFTGPNRLLVTERPGRIRAVIDGALQDKPLITLPDVASDDEEGLLGLAAHPEYEKNKYLYTAYTYKRGESLLVKIIRLIDQGDTLVQEKTIIEGIPAARFHAGTGLKFGPDGKLYVSTGDASSRENAQLQDSLAGKFLRLDDDGSIPSDNPHPQSAVWSTGHRNPQGFDWHPQTGELYATEHGPSGFDGPGGGDELNLIVKGANYGWPEVHHDQKKEGFQSPLVTFTPAEAPSGAAFSTGDLLPQWKGDLFFGALKGEGLWRVRFDSQDHAKVIEQEKLFTKKYGRIRAVTVGPDGALYLATSNRDGRGSAQKGDDKILRVAP